MSQLFLFCIACGTAGQQLCQSAEMTEKVQRLKQKHVWLLQNDLLSAGLKKKS